MTKISYVMRKTENKGALLALAIVCFACVGLFAQQQPAQLSSQGGGISAGAGYSQFVVVGGEAVASHLSSATYQGQAGFLYRSFNNLIPTYAINGNIVTPEGAAVAEGRISLLQDREGTKSHVVRVALNADGSFYFPDVYTGIYTLRVEPVSPEGDSLLLLNTYLGGVQLPQDAQVVELTADQAFANLAVLRESAPEEEWAGSSEVSGILVEDTTGSNSGARLLSGLRTSEGTPMANAQVFLTDPATRAIKFTEVTDARGEFRFTGIASRAYGFLVEYEGKTFEMGEELSVSENGSVQVTAVVADGQVSGTVEQLTGLYEDAEEGVRLYPNPLQDQLNLELNSLKPGLLYIHVFDKQGRELQVKVLEVTAGSLQEELDFSALPQGLYLLSIRQQDKLILRKVVKE